MTRKRNILTLGRIAAGGVARRLIGDTKAADRALGAALVAELDGMKGAAMKLGQIISYMEVPVPDEVQAALARLQVGEVGMDLVAVAVKVRYPDVVDSFDEDIDRLRRLVRLFSAATVIETDAIVSELGARLHEECDYGTEARWQQVFASAAAGIEDVSVPEIVGSHCGEGVLTTAWSDGMRFAQFAECATSAARLRAGRALARFAWSGIFSWEVMHADPHPGNFLFSPEGEVVALDFGCIKRLPPAFVDAWRRSLLCVVDGHGDFEAATRDAGMVGGKRFDFAEHRAMLEWMVRPYTCSSFRFDRAYMGEATRYGRPTSMHTLHTTIPPAWIWFARTSFGLHSVLGRLGVEGDMRASLLDPLRGASRRLELA